MDYIKKIIRNKELRNKVLFVMALLFIFRILSHIPIPGPDSVQMKIFLSEFFKDNAFLGFLDIFSGGGLSNFSVVLMGVGPYITASIIMQLLTMVVPKFQQLSKEGESGHNKINQYSRYLTVPIAVIQGYSMILLIKRSATMQADDGTTVNIIGDPTLGTWALMILSIIVGTMFVMWLGELITEKGIGNGVSLIIFAGIVAMVPTIIGQTVIGFKTSGYDPIEFWKIIGILILGILSIIAVVFVTEGERKLPVSYAKKVRGNRIYGGMDTHLPLKINTAGVIPIIFAGAFLNLPQLIGLLSNARTPQIANFAKFISTTFSPNNWPYAIAYFALIVAFTYFSAFMYFKPKDVSENIQKQGGFIPGIRPGRQTAEYLIYVLNRLTLSGSIFLGIIAVLPFALQNVSSQNAAMTIGGTGLLIVVTVVLETIRKIKAQLIMRTYEKA